MDSIDQASDEALRRESVRLYERYQQELVESLNLCPWAKRARLDGNVRIEVSVQRDRTAEHVFHAIDSWAVDTRIEIGLVLFPRLDLDRVDFERFVAELVAADARRHELVSAPFAFAAFHPQATPDTTKPERLIPFWRRSPDPTLQLVRLSALERVRQADPPGTRFIDPKTFDFSLLKLPKPVSLRQKISQANHETLNQLGLQEVEARIAAIAEDRAATYRSLGMAPASWETACG